MQKKRLLVLTERFFPEEFLINDLAQEWQRRGFAVEVLTQVPSYPYDKIFQGYDNCFCQTTKEIPGMAIHRVKTVLGYNHSVKRKVLNYISFAWRTAWWAVFNGWRYDAVFTCHTGPLTMAAAGCVCRWLWWRKTVIWTQDPWPDTVYNYGVKPRWWIQKCLNGLVRFFYWGYRDISVSCGGFVRLLSAYTRKRIIFFPQWTTQAAPLPEKRIENPIVFTFAGNVGSVQNLERVVRAFGTLGQRGKGDSATTQSRVELRIVGDGIYLERLRKLVSDNGYKNVVFTGRKPKSEMPRVFSESDVLIISLNPEFNLTVPAKFQAYIAAGRPILGIVCGETAELIRRYNLGRVADPASDEAICDAVEKMISQTKDFAEWRKNGLALSNEQFCREKIVDRMTALLSCE